MVEQIDEQILNFGWTSNPSTTLQYKTYAGSSNTGNSSTSNRAFFYFTSGGATQLIHSVSMTVGPWGSTSITSGAAGVPSSTNTSEDGASGTFKNCLVGLAISTSTTWPLVTDSAWITWQSAQYYQQTVLIDKKTPIVLPNNKKLVIYSNNPNQNTQFNWVVTTVEVN